MGADGYWADTCRTYVNGSSAEVDDIREQLYSILVTPDGAVELAQAMKLPLSPQAEATWTR